MECLEPWIPVEGDENVREGMQRQLAREVARGHPLHGIAVELLARGNGDDCLFKLLDGTGRVAVVHMVWQGRQAPPWPWTELHADLGAWRRECMLPEHEAWLAAAAQPRG